MLLKGFMSMQNNMVSAQRCINMLDILQEKVVEGADPLAQRPDWPEQGSVEFKDVSLRYRPNTEIVLNNLSFKVQTGEKIGVVGRTGAGKSTICLSISRIVELCEGLIEIDGIDIGKISLDELRKRITVIP